jgi:hypothetical protein
LRWSRRDSALFFIRKFIGATELLSKNLLQTILEQASFPYVQRTHKFDSNIFKNLISNDDQVSQDLELKKDQVMKSLIQNDQVSPSPELQLKNTELKIDLVVRDILPIFVIYKLRIYDLLAINSALPSILWI